MKSGTAAKTNLSLLHFITGRIQSENRQWANGYVPRTEIVVHILAIMKGRKGSFVLPVYYMKTNHELMVGKSH